MATARSSQWLDERVARLLQRLAEHGMILPDDVARQFLSDHLDTTARLMRIGRQAVKVYVTDDVIDQLADQLLGVDKAHAQPNVFSLAARRRKRG